MSYSRLKASTFLILSVLAGGFSGHLALKLRVRGFEGGVCFDLATIVGIAVVTAWAGSTALLVLTSRRRPEALQRIALVGTTLALATNVAYFGTRVISRGRIAHAGIHKSEWIGVRAPSVNCRSRAELIREYLHEDFEIGKPDDSIPLSPFTYRVSGVGPVDKGWVGIFLVVTSTRPVRGFRIGLILDSSATLHGAEIEAIGDWRHLPSAAEMLDRLLSGAGLGSSEASIYNPYLVLEESPATNQLLFAIASVLNNATVKVLLSNRMGDE